MDLVRRIPGVKAADGFLQGYAQFVEKDGKTTIQTAGAPTFGISWSGGDQVGPARIAAGRRPVRDGEVAMDVGTARRNGFKVGDRVKVLLTGPAERFKIVGLFKLGTQGDFGAVSFAAFDPHTAQRVFGAPGLFDAVNVRVEPGISIAAAKRALERALNPGGRFGGGYEVTSAAVVADETRKPVDEFLTVLNDALLGFAGVGLLVGGFIIFNTFTILVSQRMRELGLLRAMGASGPQVDRLGPDRSRGDRRLRVRGRVGARRRARAAAALVVTGVRVPGAAELARRDRPHGRRVGGRRASASRCWPPSCRRCARPAPRRSPRSATSGSAPVRPRSGVGRWSGC